MFLLFKTDITHTHFPIKMKILQFPVDDERLKFCLSESHSYCLNIGLMPLTWLKHIERLKPWTVYLYPCLKTSVIPQANVSGHCRWAGITESHFLFFTAGHPIAKEGQHLTMENNYRGADWSNQCLWSLTFFVELNYQKVLTLQKVAIYLKVRNKKCQSLFHFSKWLVMDSVGRTGKIVIIKYSIMKWRSQRLFYLTFRQDYDK